MTAITEAPEFLRIRRILREAETFQVLASDVELVGTLCQDPVWHREFTLSLAIHDQNDEVGAHVPGALRPVLAAPGLSGEEAEIRYHEIKYRLVQREKARDDEDRPVGVPRDVWEGRCEDAIEEAVRAFTGVTS